MLDELQAMSLAGLLRPVSDEASKSSQRAAADAEPDEPEDTPDPEP